MEMADESCSAADTGKPPQIHKDMDEISEKNAKQENEENVSGNNIVHNNLSSQTCSNILSSPRLKCSDQNTKKFTFSSVLRPSQLNGNVSNSSSKPAFSLNPSRLNPFAKLPPEDSNSRDEQKDASVVTSSGNTPKFLPLFQNGSKSEPTVKTITPTTSSVSSNNFVFGQNLKERVINDANAENAKFNNCTNTNGASDAECDSNLKEIQSEETSASCSKNANGTSDMLFSSVLKETPVLDTGRSQGTKSLSESAREYEESRAVKRKYEEVEVKTGEEEETNVLQIMCKLFAFDKTAGGSWQERGRGILRLNDQNADAAGNSHSRLVFRTAGSLRVVLNTKIWAEMTIQRASDKSIRLTAFDYSGEIKVFLLTGTPEDIKQLQKHLEIRVKKEMDKHKNQKTIEIELNAVNSAEPEVKRMTEEPKSNN
ncbi:hypothetical protein ILUMI_23048 [Ignelater luminosus]|uniref:RanBD1 domain-containing protein n=1 Tax=Ignelater luminosus TaxID=2038154 RepID=A0A8K0CCR2_IGNLU|nr:hypothetical protein ILUMI_23048 [Ignelater luminosus]